MYTGWTTHTISRTPGMTTIPMSGLNVSGFAFHSDNFYGLRFNLFEGSRYVNNAIKLKLGGPLVSNQTDTFDIDFARQFIVGGFNETLQWTNMTVYKT